MPEDEVDDLLAEELLQKYSPFPGPFERGVVACTGSEFCRFAVVETKERAVKWARWLDGARPAVRRRPSHGRPAAGRRTLGARREDAGVIRMHFSGCSASCAQPQIADIGFRGDVAHVGERIVEAVDIGMGGSLGPDAGFIDWIESARPVDDVPDALLRAGPALPGRAPRRRALPQLGPARPRTTSCAATLAGLDSDHAPVAKPMKGFRIRDEMNGIAEPPGKTWFWELEAGVIFADRCIQCGTCVAVCPSNSIGVDEDTGLPELVKMCTGCSLCWDFCPRGGLRYEALWPPSTPDSEEPSEAPVVGQVRRGRHLLEDHRWAPRRRARGGASASTRCAPGRRPTTSRTAAW